MLVVIQVFSHRHEADLACSALRAAGIEATLADQHTVAANWLYSNAIGGVKLLVPVADVAAARAVLSTPAEIVPDDAVAAGGTPSAVEPSGCPRCGSSNVTRVTPGRRLAFVSWLVVGVPLLPVLRRTKCGDCGYKFRAV